MHREWRFSPGQLKVEAGGTITAINRGGEFHTFTPVVAFGGGCVDELNEPLGLTPVPEVWDSRHLRDDRGRARRASPPVRSATGTQRFMCLIHPWMRTAATIG